MKKVLLSSAALATLAFAAPASAESGVKLDLGGYFKGYMTYTSQDDTTGDPRNLDIVRATEVHFSGETTLDNGLTVGAHIEGEADQGDSFDVNESYAYFSGSWGRVNFGSEDGAAFLLQVAAPSANSDFDSVRQVLNPFNYTTVGSSSVDTEQDYDQDVTAKADKITYLSPVFSGFQAGVSYTPEIRTASRDTEGVDDDDSSTSEYGNAFDVALRYEGEFDGFKLTAGVGYTHASVETDSASVDDRQAWDAGLDLDIGAWGVGVAYTDDNMGSEDDDVTNWVVGVDYTTGPFVLGASYYNQDDEVGTDVETDRYTGGVVYNYGPGMSFRGTVTYVDHEIDGADDENGTSVLLGTSISF